MKNKLKYLSLGAITLLCGALFINNNNSLKTTKAQTETIVSFGNSFSNYIGTDGNYILFIDYYIDIYYTINESEIYTTSLSLEINPRYQLNGTEGQFYTENNVVFNYDYGDYLFNSAISFTLNPHVYADELYLQGTITGYNYLDSNLSKQNRFDFIANRFDGFGGLPYWNATNEQFHQVSLFLEFGALFNKIESIYYNQGYDVGEHKGYELGYGFGEQIGYQNGTSEGYDVGYGVGFQDGYNRRGDDNFNPSWFTILFDSLNSIFQVEIFPNFKLWYMIGAPLLVALVVAVLKFLR